MKIAVLGAGNGGCAVAADMSLKGHEVTLIKTSGSLHNSNFKYLLEHSGKISLIENNEIKTTFIKNVTTDLSMLSECEVIIVYIQSIYHENLIKRIVTHLKPGQILMFNPGYISTAFALKHGVNKDVILAEAESSFIDCRITQPGMVKVSFRNVNNPIGIFPSSKKEQAAEKLDKIGFPFSYISSVAEAGLHNPNLIVHTVGAIMSIPRIEKTHGDYVMYHEVFTPSVWNILEKLDGEKMDVLEKMGFERLPYAEACKMRNSPDDKRSAKEVFMWYAAMPSAVAGPTVVDSRYITEDVPQGLVMLESLGKHLGVKTPMTTSLIEIASAALRRDLREKGRTVENLGEENLKLILNDFKH